jgi:arginyl-tRNA synthetase
MALISFIKNIIEKSLLELNFPVKEQTIDIPKEEKFGDYSSNIAMLLTKELKKAPRVIAAEIIEKLEYDKSRISKIEIAGPGFINFFINDAFYTDEITTVLEFGDNFGKSEKNKGKKANLEWVSANPTKPLHAGHGRQICLGKSIANLLEWSGFELTREYYYNDAGNQMSLLAKSVKARYEQIFDENYPFPEDGYQGNYIKDIAEVIRLEKGDSLRGTDELDYFRKKGEEYNFESIKSTLVELGIKHDIFFNESSLYSEGTIKNIIEEFTKAGLTYEKDGAIWLKLEKEQEHQKDKVIVKASGEPTYRLPDMAYHINKIKRGYDLIVDIFGSDHGETYREVLKGISSLGYDTSNIKVIIHQMVTFKSGNESVKMSGRFGTFYALDDLISDIGKDAVQFFFIMRSAGSHLDFDIELAKDESDKNPVYYLQYAHARICGILRNAGELMDDFDSKNIDFSLLKEKDEIDLIKILLQFPLEVESAAYSLEPHKIITYLNQVAENFHRFYRNCRVINTENKPLSFARLGLALSAKQILKNGFHILGISAPERMEKLP